MRAIRRLTLTSLVLVVAGLTAGAAVADECSPALLENVACRLGLIAKKKTPPPDAAKAASGQALDHAAAPGIDHAYPGAGAAVEPYWATQRSVAPVDASALAPAGAPPVGAYPGAYAAPPPVGPPTVASPTIAPPAVATPSPDGAHFCSTPYGRYGPYPNAVALGAPCWVTTPNGVVYGVGS